MSLSSGAGGGRGHSRGRGLQGVVLGCGPMALVVLVVVDSRTGCLSIQAFTVTTRWSCHLVIRHVEQ
jgi:hypothetical protein